MCAPMLGMAGHVHVRVQPAPFADADMRPDHAIRPDDDATADHGLRINPSRPIDVRLAGRHAAATMAPTSASATIFSGNLRLAAKPPHVLFVGDLLHVILDGVARHDGLAELGLVDGQEEHLRRLDRPCRAPSGTIAPAVCAMPSIISTPGKHRPAGKWPMNCGSLKVTFLIPIAASSPANPDDAVDHQEGIAVRQRLENLGDVGRLQGDGCVAHGKDRYSSLATIAADWLRAPSLEQDHFAKPDLERLGRRAAPARAGRHSRPDVGPGRNLRALSDGRMIHDANPRAQYDKILQGRTAGNAGLRDNHAMAADR